MRKYFFILIILLCVGCGSGDDDCPLGSFYSEEPGHTIIKQDPPTTAVIPEPATLLLVGLGAGYMFIRKEA